jgi:protein O-GlcNAcase/histone acetyltransferase
LDFIYAIAPGLDIMYSDENDWNFLVKKVNQLREIGCRHFAILFDDIPSKLSDNDQNLFSSFARAHAHITNRLFKHLSGLSLLFCPTVYCGQMADYDIKGNAYLNELGELLHEEIGIFWTGPKVVSVEIKVESIKELQQVIKRKPIIWDNLHANDYDIRQIFFGPYSGRSLELKNEVAGILSNPNCQFWANYNPLRTLGMFNVEIDSWNPRQAFLESSREWIRYFGNEELTVDEIQLLGDCYYTQGQMGEHGIQIVKSIQWILNHPTDEWNDYLDTFKSFEVRLNSLCAKLMATTNRELLYDFYLAIWELREETEYVSKWVEWKQSGKGEFQSPEIVPRRKGILYEFQDIIHSD